MSDPRTYQPADACAPSVTIGPTARVSTDVRFGNWVMVESRATIEGGTVIGNHVTICEGSHVSSGCVIADFAIVGKQPVERPGSETDAVALPGTVLGVGCVIGSHTVLTAGSTFGEGCVVGDGAGVRERCTIGSGARIDDGARVMPGVTIGEGAHVSAGTVVTADVPAGAQV